jgi:stage III sporulation protein AD
MNIVKIVFLCLLAVLLYALMRQLRPEFAPLVALAGVGVILVQLIGVLLNVSSTVENLISLAGLEKKNVEILIKALAVCVITQFASDVCYDNSFSSAAAAVELAGRVGAIALAMPMIKAAAEIAIGLINA